MTTTTTESYVLVPVVPAVEVRLSLEDIEEAELALQRIEPDLAALDARNLSPMNTDVVVAASTVLGVLGRILELREAIALLPFFDMRSVDSLSDYAKGAWFAYVGNQPLSPSRDDAHVAEEVTRLRGKFLNWGTACAADGIFDPAALAQIREGSGYRDSAGDLVALVLMFREQWDRVKNMTGITPDDLARGAQLGAAAFAIISRRDNQLVPLQAESALRARRAWTLLDRAYTQCRRAIAYLRFDEGDVELIAPNLRRNRGGTARANPAPEPVAQPSRDPAPGRGGLGSTASPFIPRDSRSATPHETHTEKT
jgi:hypothetical protein